jgi:hypothetical protein
MGLQFGFANVLSNYDNSLVFAMDPANPSCFAGPPTSNELGTGMSIYNNVSGSVTASLDLDNPRRFYRGAPVYKQILTPTSSTGVSYLTGGNNPGIGVVTGGGGGPANTYTGHSIFFYPTCPMAASPIYTNYSNIGGWQTSTTYEDMGDGWYRAYTTWFDTVTRGDGKYWAINPASATVNQPIVVYWAGPFKETRAQNATIGSNGARSVNNYTLIQRNAASNTSTGLAAPTNSIFDHSGLHDLSGNQNNMTINGTIYYDTDGQGSLIFNGSNTFLLGESNAIGSNSTEFTLEAWAKTATASSYQTVIGTESTLRQIGFLNNGVVYGGNGGGGNILRTTFTGSVSTNVWYHLCMTFDGQTAYCYVDGVLRDSNTIGALSGYPTPARPIIGSYNTSGAEYLNGKVGTARIYNRALSATEVANNYAATRARYSK